MQDGDQHFGSVLNDLRGIGTIAQTGHPYKLRTIKSLLYTTGEHHARPCIPKDALAPAPGAQVSQQVVKRFGRCHARECTQRCIGEALKISLFRRWCVHSGERRAGRCSSGQVANLPIGESLQFATAEGGYHALDSRRDLVATSLLSSTTASAVLCKLYPGTIFAENRPHTLRSILFQCVSIYYSVTECLTAAPPCSPP